ncbi:hypothetical protein VTP01DRAFT_7474, partial [Rhizomucor pusillus]|uniref:uncharacterized protein n=1 Tax=Rhizomucor pusillus TaxID=4840 RepID=UPI003744AC87
MIEKNKFLALKQVPAGIWEETDKLNGTPYGTSRSKLANESPGPLEKWRTYVASNFDSISEQVQISWGSINNVEDDDNDNPLRDSGDVFVDYRIANVLEILRSDLPEDHVEVFKETLMSTQELISDDIANLAAVIRAAMMHFAAKGGSQFDIAEILPRNAIRNTSMLFRDQFVTFNTQIATDAETVLFEQQHIEKLHSIYLGNMVTTAQQRALGSIDADFFLSKAFTIYHLHRLKCPKQSTKPFKKYCKNLENMWADNKLLSRSAEYVIRILLRLHLAPKREAHHKDLISRKAKEKKESKNSVKTSAIRNLQRKTDSRIMQAGDETRRGEMVHAAL